MKILKSWLEDYIKTDLSTEELADALTFSGTLVDEIITKIDQKIIVVKSLSVDKHPDADRLHLVKVTDGQKTYDIVCGAPNVTTDKLYPLAQVGTKIGDFEIKEAIIRGQKSEGMLCSEKELGISDNHEGIMELDNTYKLGDALANYLSEDAVFDLEITPNRGDCLSHFGIAREISAVTNQKFTRKPIELDMIHDQSINHISVEIENDKFCPAYFARVIRGIKIGPSPKWLCDRLNLCGIRPINNVVDVTNYIMLDLGHPLHAFDALKIKDNKIIVRSAKVDEKLITLDNTALTLGKDNLVIADSKDPIALAGVMGGLDSEITETTTEIVLEAAVFNRKSIRKTSKQFGLQSEASYRFERGVDIKGLEYAINKAAQMIKELAGGQICAGIVKNETAIDPVSIQIEYTEINDLLGIDIQEEEINHILKNLGIKIENNVATIPSFRNDLMIWQDLAEEVARIYGLTKIPRHAIEKTTIKKKSAWYYKEYLKDILVDNGFSEVYNYPFVSENDVKQSNTAIKNLLELSNPIQPENKYLRDSLIPGLLRSVAKNPTFDPVMIFEIGHVFTKNDEKTFLGIICSGKRSKEILQSTVEQIKKHFKLDLNTIEARESDLKTYKIKKTNAFFVEVDLSDIIKSAKIKESELVFAQSKKNIHYRPVSKFPSVTRDLAFLLDKKIKPEDLEEIIYSISDNVARVELFDEYSSDKLGKNIKNLAYHIYLQDMTKTLTDTEAQAIIGTIVKTIEKQFDAKLRVQ